MIEKLKKYGRSFMRAYEEDILNISMPLVLCFIAGTIGGIAGAGIFGAGAGIAFGAGLAVFTVGSYMAEKTAAGHRESIDEFWDEGARAGPRLVGSRGRVLALKATQKRIDTLTKEFMTAAQLPPKVESKVWAYLRDAEEFAAHVNVYAGNQVKDEFIFYREVFDAQGQKSVTPVGCVKTRNGVLFRTAAAVVPPVPAAVPAKQGIRVLKPLQYTKKPKNQTVS